ncbi:MAG: YtxH domain-containing protein [Candidatus Kapaibacteriota bacterium]|jgi:gas vesicle protein
MESRHQSPFTGFLAGAVIGGLAGAVLALLFAPKSGKELRKDLADTSEDLIGRAKEMLANEATAVEATVNRAGDVLHRAVDDAVDDVVNEGRMKAERIVSSARQQAESLLSNAEQVLRDARSRAEGAKREGSER